MSGHPFGDQVKVLVDSDSFGFGGAKKGVESGVVVEVPDKLIYLGFHSFAFENSFDNAKALKETREFYAKLLSKKVFWESFQDRGRRFVEGKDEFVYIKMTDILFYADSVDDDIQIAVDPQAFNPS